MEGDPENAAEEVSDLLGFVEGEKTKGRPAAALFVRSKR
jgi:hypothetical protein